MKKSYQSRIAATRISHALGLISALMWPGWVFAQASPFLTGANSLQTNILAWATPIAVILVMVLGIMAMANRISWGWPIAALLGIAVVFGAPQLVTWTRGMFGV
jgi:type IV secretion system protein VirB2